MQPRKVAAVLVDDIDEHRGTPGAYDIRTIEGEDRPAGMGFICPCGCGRDGWLPFRPSSHPQSWDWDGNERAPTLKPSVKFNGGCRWHGWLTAGVWKEC